MGFGEKSTMYIHESAICESVNVGQGTRVWAFAHILPDAKIGVECNICDGVFIENDVTVGDRVTIKCGVQLWDGVHLEDDVFVGPNATFTNDKFPRSRIYPEEFLETRVEKGASLGANSTILPGITIGRNALVGAGAVVTKDVPSSAIVVGNPARIVGYVDTLEAKPKKSLTDQVGKQLLDVGGAYIQTVPLFEDIRGKLVAAEIDDSLPFQPKRWFSVYAVPGTEVRGEHAHRECEQFLVCIRGEVSCIVDDGTQRAEVHLNSPDIGLYIPPRVWGIQYKYSADAILTVFASHKYDDADYIRDYEEFIAMKRN